jgi:uncharacterized protein YjbI with pentapeptide repeats
MAGPRHLKLLKKGSAAWNTWRVKHLEIRPHFGGANLNGADLSETDLRGADLNRADLRGALLSKADLLERRN